MANEEHLSILKQGVDVWNKWRDENRDVRVDLRGTDLRGVKLGGVNLQGASVSMANLSKANLSNANLIDANLFRSDLSGAILRGAQVWRAVLTAANLQGANLQGADLHGARIWKADLRRANLSKTNLNGVALVGSRIDEVNVSGSSIYGISVWDVKGEFKEQRDLIITRERQPIITVDNIKVAQFIYLFLNNEEIRDVINTLTSKSVLILGRFTGEGRKEVLDGLRNKLREYDLLPIVFDFDRPADRDYTETVQTLAGLSLFVIIDVTNPKSTPLEMEAIVKQFKIPYVPIIDLSADPRPFAMIVDSQKSFHWVLKTYGYKSKDELLDNIEDTIITRALEKHNELREQKASEPEVLTLDDLKKAR